MNIAILGSTGSIGTQTLEVVKGLNAKVVGLSAFSNIEKLKEQIKEFCPEEVAVFEKEKADELKEWVGLGDVKVHQGMDGLNKIAEMNSAETIVTSVVGSVGIEPTMNAIRAKKNIALANKETLVAAGSIVMDEVKKNNVKLMPIDSEHSALFQCLNGEKKADVRRIILTCSGGPFKDSPIEEIRNATKKNALNHPTWNMGGKITIDSASLMNKGLEVIEAHWLYGVPYDNIDVVIHPQSIIHSMVEYKDYSIMAQLGVPSMKIPIQYALTHPNRRENNVLPKFDFTKNPELTFKEPDFEKFPCLKLAYTAGKTGGTLPAVMNAANEIAVEFFLKEKIKFMEIAETVKRVMEAHNTIQNPTLDKILDADKKAKQETREILEK